MKSLRTQFRSYLRQRKNVFDERMYVVSSKELCYSCDLNFYLLWKLLGGHKKLKRRVWDNFEIPFTSINLAHPTPVRYN